MQFRNVSEVFLLTCASRAELNSAAVVSTWPQPPMRFPALTFTQSVCLVACLAFSIGFGQAGAQDAALSAEESAEKARAQIAFVAPSDAVVAKEVEAIMATLGRRRITLMEAVRNTLLNDPNVKLGDEEIHRRAAELQIETGAFDWHVRSELEVETRDEELDSVEVDRVRGGFAEVGLSSASRVRSDTRSLSLALTHQFRNGITLRPFLEYSGAGTSRDRDLGDPDFNRSDVGLELVFPLAAGRGRVATAGGEMAAKIELEGSYWFAYHTASRWVAETVQAYWLLVAAQERLGLLVRSEVLNGSLETLTREMIESDLVPRAEEAQVKARTLSVTASRVDAEIALQDAQAQLAQTMGYDLNDIIHAPLAADGFPEVAAAPSYDRELVQHYVNEALKRRGDRLGSVMSEGASRLLAEQSRRNVKPRADLFVRGFGSGVSSGRSSNDVLDTWAGGLDGPGVAVGISLDWPIIRNREKGLLRQRMSTVRTQQLTTQALELEIARNLSTAQYVLHSSGRLFETQKQALSEFDKALNFERERFLLGESTAIDSVTTEERLTDAGLGVIDARLQNAIAIAQLRFGTATMLASSSTLERQLVRSALTTVPNFANPAPVLPIDAVPAASEGGRTSNRDPYRVLHQIDTKSGRD
jgi:outer membrane protein TolC